ncbi:hypothetical protein [Zavarzinella formosa]|uniref:hypothetical protein n=1 Tax=Zavarzinella formosa TaxID=360055 RepID=UPI00030EB318|nr:hypothetical protein [Zavarzinella formosa]
MNTLNQCRRVMRPHPSLDDMPPACAWCGNPVGRGVVCTRGKNLGKDAVVCGECLTPPPLGRVVSEMTDERRDAGVDKPKRAARTRKEAA